MTTLGLQAEREWRRLRRHLDFADGFWLGFLFTSSPAVAEVFRSRLAAVLQFRAASLEELHPQEPEELPEALPVVLTRKEDGPRYLWVEALRTDPGPGDRGGPWWNAWESFLLRLNERREMMRQVTRGGVLLVAPPWVKPLARDGAPDLWSFRSLVLEPRPEPQHPVETVQDQRTTADHRERDLPWHSSPRPSELPPGSPSEGTRLLKRVAVLIQEGRSEEAVDSAVEAIESLSRDSSSGSEQQAQAHWWLAQARLAAGDPAGAEEALRTACELSRREDGQAPLQWSDLLASLALDRQDVSTAREIYDELLEQTRTALTQHGESSERLRDVSVSLEKLGDVLLKEGDSSQARSRYEESLEFDRRLLEEYGESPERLRGVSLSLERLGDVLLNEGDSSQARSLYEESLELRHRLLEEYGESPERLRDVSLSLERLGDVLLNAGDSSQARSLYEESLELRRRLLKEYGESPDRLRGVSLSLERLGDVLLNEGDSSQARSLYEESLELRRRLLAEYRESPERLRDVSVSLEKLGDVLLSEGDTLQARSRYEESLELSRRLLGEYGESPERLRDVSVSLERLSRIFQGLEQPAAALEALEEAIQLTRRRIELWGTSVRAEADLDHLEALLAAQSPPVPAGDSA